MAGLDVRAWLRTLGLESYEEAFRANAIDADVLCDLTEADLERLGVLLGHRKKMLNAIAGLRAAGEPSAQAASGLSPAFASTEGERRQVTVLFADLAGYTALSNELDAEDVHRLLGRFFSCIDRIIAEHGGHVDKHIGDSVMAVFGAPIAHGNDAERAIRSALAIRAAMPSLASDQARALQTHIGIASGEVVASATGSEAHREYTVTGETVNLAARLTSEARAGEILISNFIRRALESSLDCADAGSLPVKGFAAPVRAYRLNGFRQDAKSDLAPMVGRTKELQQFRAALSACRETKQGGTLYIRGEAGIGKTRLVKECESEAKAAGFACNVVSVHDFGSGIDAVRILVRSILGINSKATIETREAAVPRAVENGLVRQDDVVFLNDLLDLAQPTALRGLYDAMDNAARHQGKRRLLTGLVSTLCLRQPRLLVVEDVHWADSSTRDYLATLAGAVGECPAILVMTSRPEGDLIDGRWRGEAGGASLVTIDLAPLRREDAMALASSAAFAGISFIEPLVDRAGGNPFFLEQLLRHSQEDTQTGVPGTVQALVQARVDLLDPLNRRALQAASILGQGFPLAALRHLLADPDFDCTDLISYAVLRPAGDSCSFAHALIRDAVYASLLRGRRRELHGLAAEWYATRDISLRAKHLDRAEDPRAPAAYAEATDAQSNLLRYERALEFAERGHRLATSAEDSVRLGLLRAGILRELGRVQEAMQAFREIALSAGDSLAQCRARIGVASCVRLLGGNEEGIAALKLAEPLAQRHQAHPELADIHYYFGSLLFATGDIENCLKHHQKGHQFALKAGHAEYEARALSGLGDALYGRGHMRLAIEHFRRCRALCQDRGFGRIEVGSTHMLGAIRRYLFEWEKALENLRESVAMAKRVGNFRTQMVALNILGEVLVDGARPDEARRALTEALQLAERFDNDRYRAYVLYELGRAHYYAGDDAQATLEQALGFSRRVGMRFIGPRVLAALALVSEPHRAAALSEGESIVKSGCLAHNALWFYRDAIEAHLQARELNAVRGCAAALAELTRDDPLPWSEFFIERGRALADFHAGERDRMLFEKLRRLRDEAERGGLKAPIREIDAALAEQPAN
jgi:class 3 adenylate cyclase/tetratricopeptide (TPR) repeat protein